MRQLNLLLMSVYNQQSGMLMYISAATTLYLLTPSHVTAWHVSSIYNGLDRHENWSLLPQNCGQGGTPPEYEARVMGGHGAFPGQFPWMANLIVNYRHMCGGSIINKQYILTAAHCCDGISPESSSIRVGGYNLYKDCTTEGCVYPVQNLPVESFTMHENYTSDIFLGTHNDICLIRLRRPITFNEYVHPVCLPVYQSLMHRSFAGENMEIAGWGRSDKHIWNSTPILQTTPVPVISNQECQKMYPDIKPIEMCAGGLVGDNLRQICMGDSGGPLMKDIQVMGRKKYFIFGITSTVLVNTIPGTSYKFCDVKVPGVFVRVTSYLKWILDHIKS